MANTDEDVHTQCMQRFITLANTMKEEGIDTRVVSAGLMTASAVYATYVFAGNDGRLNSAGTARVTEAFAQQLDQVQEAKKARAQGGV